MKPFFSIITPTILRPSLKILCESLDAQTFKNWTHLIAVDRTWHKDEPSIVDELSLINRYIYPCEIEHRNFGNSCRHNAWRFVNGIYCLYSDDDNHFCHDEALSDLAAAIETADFPDWGIVPMWRHGRQFFNDPPGLCMTDTGNLFVKREIGQWPDGPEYVMDGLFIEELKRHPEYVYKALPDVRPVINMPYSSEGK